MAQPRKHGGLPWLLLVALVAAWWLWPKPRVAPPAPPPAAPVGVPAAAPPVVRVDAPAPVATPETTGATLPAFLPAEARSTIALILRGGPFPHRQDGSVFGNRERRLPRREHGYYREYTVPTPGLSHRGARRIVTGGDPPREWYYSDDHYDSFRPFQPPSAEAAR